MGSCLILLPIISFRIEKQIPNVSDSFAPPKAHSLPPALSKHDHSCAQQARHKQSTPFLCSSLNTHHTLSMYDKFIVL